MVLLSVILAEKIDWIFNNYKTFLEAFEELKVK